jgi:hypothetical protein
LNSHKKPGTPKIPFHPVRIPPDFKRKDKKDKKDKKNNVLFSTISPFRAVEKLSILSILSILSPSHFEDICVADDRMGHGAWKRIDE